MNLHEIQSAYQQGTPVEEINQAYQKGMGEAELTDDEKLELWKQVCAFCNFEMIDQLISLGWRAMGIEDRYGNNLLHLMAEAPFNRSYHMSEGQIYETTKRLLANKVSPISKNSDGFTALMLGAKAGYFEMLQAYQDAGVKIDWVDNQGNTLLHISANNAGHVASDSGNFVKFISIGMDAGLDPHQKNNYGETAIDFAIKSKSKLVGAILSGCDLSNSETSDLHLQAGGQDLFQACINQDLAAIAALIKLGSNVNDEYDKEGNSYNKMLPLAISVILHDFESIDLLLKNGADPMLRDSKSWHPLRYLYVVESNMNTNSSQFENKTFPKILHSFVTACFDINALIDDDENTLLTISAKNADRLQLFNSNSVAKTLIQEAIFADADVNKTNRDGISALMYLGLTDLKRAEKEILMLLEQGAKTDLKDKDGKTALIYAANNSDKTTAKTYCELLAQFGDILASTIDNSGKSALDYAVKNDNENLVVWLLQRK